MIIIIKMMMKMMKRRRKTNICLSLVVLKRRANLRLSMWNLNWYNQVRHIIILLELCLTNILMARKMRALMFLDWLIKQLTLFRQDRQLPALQTKTQQTCQSIKISQMNNLRRLPLSSIHKEMFMVSILSLVSLEGKLNILVSNKFSITCAVKLKNIVILGKKKLLIQF